MPRNLAIVIGINNYQYQLLPSLKYAKHDAEAVKLFLLNEADFDEVCLFADDSPEYDGYSTFPSRMLIRRFLRKRFEMRDFLGQEDSLWFFFSGHGIRYANRDYLMPADGDPEDPPETAIPLHWISEQLTRSGAGNVVMVLDACRLEGGKGSSDFGVDISKGITTIFSCRADEASWEIDEPISQGAFTYVFLNSLRLQLQEGSWSLLELEQYLQHSLRRVINQHHKTPQTPHIRCDSGSHVNKGVLTHSIKQAKTRKVSIPNKISPREYSFNTLKNSLKNIRIPKRSQYLGIGITLLIFGLPTIYFFRGQDLQDPLPSEICRSDFSLGNAINILSYETGIFLVRVYSIDDQLFMDVCDISRGVVQLTKAPAEKSTVLGQFSYVSTGEFNGRQVEYASQVFSKLDDSTGGFARLFVVEVSESGNESRIIRVEDAEVVQVFNLPSDDSEEAQGLAGGDTILFFETESYGIRVFSRDDQRRMNIFDMTEGMQLVNGKLVSLSELEGDESSAYISSDIKNNQDVKYVVGVNQTGKGYIQILDSDTEALLHEEFSISRTGAEGEENTSLVPFFIIAVRGDLAVLEELKAQYPEAFFDETLAAYFEERLINIGITFSENDSSPIVIYDEMNQLRKKEYDVRLLKREIHYVEKSVDTELFDNLIQGIQN